LDDNRVLKAAAARGGAVVPVFIIEDPEVFKTASGWWLGRSLSILSKDLSAKRSRLVVRRGDAFKVLATLVRETGANAVFWDESFEPLQRKRDEKIRAKLVREEVFCEAINDALLFDPARILNKQGTPFKVFTPFWNHLLSLPEPAPPVSSSAMLFAPSRWPRSEKIMDPGSGGGAKWAKKMEPFWTPGARGASSALRKFLNEKIENYHEGRELPSIEGTSKLSPHLHFGEISVRKIWHETHKRMASRRRPGKMRSSEAFLRQIVWREFASSLLFHYPATISEPLRKEFLKFKWKKSAELFHAWKKGMTGYPIVDAGMRQLWKTGWMHNRVRMIVASFLVKDLLQDWREGAAWFMETLLDADLANNTFGWQWVAGCGADAAPYFRIFNPVLQGEKFDPAGDYVRRWVPELSGVPGRLIHSPWTASPEVLEKAGVQLGKDYPVPIVDHDAARKRALFVYYRLRKSPKQ
jgi:deoxyribodipyrimidine photo-lyase